MKKAVFFICFLFIISASICHAKSDEWTNNKYNFKHIKTVLILPLNIQQSVDNPFAEQKVSDFLSEELKKHNIKWVDFKYVVVKVGEETSTDMINLLQKDEKQFWQLLQEKGPNYVDAVLCIEVFSYGWSTQFVEGYYSPRISQGNGSFSGNYGGTGFNGTYTAPVTSYRYISGANEQIANAGCTFTLYDAKTLNMIWGYVDNRSKNTRAVKFAHPNAPVNRMFKSHTSPDKLMQNVIESALEKAPFVVK